MRVGVVAETIVPASGLGHFLGIGLRWLAKRNPNWEFDVVARTDFAKQYQALAENENIVFHIADETPTLRLLQRYVRVRGRDYLIGLLANHLPFESWRAQMGNTHTLWESLPEFDVVWVPHFPVTTSHWPLLYEEGFSKGPVLLTIHDLQPLFYPNDWLQYAMMNFYKTFVPFARRCHGIITHTNFQKTGITKYLGITADKVRVTPVPPILDQEALPDVDNLDDAISLLSRQYGITIPYLFYASSTGFSHKNHVGLLLAWRELQSRMQTDCPMLVCTKGGGAGRRGRVLEELVATLGLQEHVVFTGSVPMEHLSMLYRLCTFVISPTLYEGGGSGPVAEGILLAKPVLCSRIPPIEDQLHAYGTTEVTFFDPTNADAIAEAVQTAYHSQSELMDQAKKAQKQLFAAIPKLWEEWTTVYTRELIRVSQDK